MYTGEAQLLLKLPRQEPILSNLDSISMASKDWHGVAKTDSAYQSLMHNRDDHHASGDER